MKKTFAILIVMVVMMATGCASVPEDTIYSEIAETDSEKLAQNMGNSRWECYIKDRLLPEDIKMEDLEQGIYFDLQQETLVLILGVRKEWRLQSGAAEKVLASLVASGIIQEERIRVGDDNFSKFALMFERWEIIREETPPPVYKTGMNLEDLEDFLRSVIYK